MNELNLTPEQKLEINKLAADALYPKYSIRNAGDNGVELIDSDDIGIVGRGYVNIFTDANAREALVEHFKIDVVWIWEHDLYKWRAILSEDIALDLCENSPIEYDKSRKVAIIKCLIKVLGADYG